MTLGQIPAGEPFIWCGRKCAVLEHGLSSSVHVIVTNPVRDLWLSPETEVLPVDNGRRKSTQELAPRDITSPSHFKPSEVVEHCLHYRVPGQRWIS